MLGRVIVRMIEQMFLFVIHVRYRRYASSGHTPGWPRYAAMFYATLCHVMQCYAMKASIPAESLIIVTFFHIVYRSHPRKGLETL